ncbi:hypothetical protein PCA_08895 [Rhodanobacter sp. PCA2]|nr:hypothetical protein [Rhodanobacter sp. PCA2]
MATPRRNKISPCFVTIDNAARARGRCRWRWTPTAAGRADVPGPLASADRPLDKQRLKLNNAKTQRRRPRTDGAGPSFIAGRRQRGAQVESGSEDLVSRTPLIVFVLAFCLALTAWARAADGLPALQVAQLSDTPQPPSPAAVTRGALAGDFLPLAVPVMTPSGTHDVWYRLQLDGNWPDSAPPVLSFPGTLHAHLWVYAPPSYQPQSLWLQQTTDPARFSRRALATVLPHGLHAGQPVYVRVERSDYPYRTVPAVTDLASYQATDLEHVRIVTLLAGIQLAMVLAGICLWVILRDRLIRYYLAYVSTQLVYAMLASGELYDSPLGPAFALLGSHGSWLFATLSAAFSITFVIEFCSLRQTAPRSSAVFGGLRWPLFAAAALSLPPLGTYTALFATVVNLVILLASIMAIATVLLALRRGNRQARFFLVAWMPQVGFTIFRIVQLLAGWPLPPWLEYGFPLTMAFASLVVMLGLADQTMHARNERDIADHLAHHDALTGALNRRALLARLDRAVADAKHAEQPLALLFLDLDHFKAINDEHGHAVGDRCLQLVVETISHELRADDWLGRYGGEEFVIVLPHAARRNAEQIGERVRARIEKLRIPGNGRSFGITVSIGVAGLLDQRDTGSALLERADGALYQAKSAGRNRVATHASLTLHRDAELT